MRELTKEEMKLVVGGAVEMSGSGASHRGNIQPSFEKQLSKDTSIRLSGNVNYNHGKVKTGDYNIGIKHKFK